MNNAQTIFALFYAIYFAVTITLTGKFQPFDTPAMYKMKYKSWIRFLISFIALNIAPLSYFVLIFKWLSKIKAFEESFGDILIIFILSIAGFGFYRIYYGIMIFKFRDEYIFYERNLPKALLEDLNQRDSSHRDWLAHVIPGAIWIVVSVAIGYWRIK